jgi:hypothetical protein
MNKLLVGLIAGAVLGAIDGATAWFTPAVRDQMLGIIIGSTVKGVIAGVAAGWYARKVNSVPKGITFGFIVGLILAFAVAAMPQPDGSHFWWQIMVPGALLGGVIGWATQRYGRSVGTRGTVTAAMMIGLALAGVSMQAAPNVAFEKLKGLAGTWTANMMTPDGPAATMEYRVTGGGSVVMETMMAGTPHEMINMYTVDGDSVLAQHYCSAGNQPLLRLNVRKSTATQLVFDFVKVTGPGDTYINGVTIRFTEDGKAEEAWTSSGEEGVKTFYLQSRK